MSGSMRRSYRRDGAGDDPPRGTGSTCCASTVWRTTAYGGEASDLPAEVLQRFLDQVAAGEVSLGPTAVHGMDEIRRAHDDLEHGRRVGKPVVVV